MIRLYLKQSWELIRQNRLFSTLYIVGTGLAIAMTMIIAIIYYVKIVPVYPEVNRAHTFYITNSSFKTDKSTMNWAFSAKAVKEWFYNLKNVEAVSASYSDWNEEFYIQPDDQSGDYPVQVKATDPGFFKIYSFHFLEGKPFMEADLVSGIRSVVVTDELARRIFRTDIGIIGRTFRMNNMDYRISGVVRSASYLTSKSFAQVYMPYSCMYNNDTVHPKFAYVGGYDLTFLVNSKQEAAFRKEIEELVRKVNLEHAKEWTLSIWEQPASHILSVFHNYPSDEFSWTGLIRYYFLILLVLLLVPALNLSGMISSRMESRLAEMGVRKSFGASRRILLNQVMWENLLLTLLGGLLGLIIAWFTLYVARQWVFSVFEAWPSELPEGVEVTVSGEMLFAPVVFIAALLLCILLNMLSALIPAWRSLRKPIVYSLNEKR